MNQRPSFMVGNNNKRMADSQKPKPERGTKEK
jgi:hypothetical protein